MDSKVESKRNIVDIEKIIEKKEKIKTWCDGWLPKLLNKYHKMAKTTKLF